MALQADAKSHSETGECVDQVLVGRSVNQEKFGCFNSVDEIRRGRSMIEACGIRKPPGFGRELDNVLLTFSVDHIIPEAATSDEHSLPGDLTRVAKERTGFKAAIQKGRSNGD